MNKILTALATAATLTVAAVATPTTAEARRGWWGPAIVGGFAAAALAGAFARPYYGGYYGGYGYGGYAYAPGPVYYDYYAPAYAPVVYAPGPAYYYAPAPAYYGCVRWRGGYRVRVC